MRAGAKSSGRSGSQRARLELSGEAVGVRSGKSKQWTWWRLEWAPKKHKLWAITQGFMELWLAVKHQWDLVSNLWLKKTLQICRPLELTLDTMNLLSFLCFHVCLVIWIHVEHSPALPGTVSILDFCRGEAFGAQMLENGVPCGQAVRLDHPTNRKWWIFLVISPHSLGYPISLFDSHLKLVHEILIPIYSLLKLVNDIYFP